MTDGRETSVLYNAIANFTSLSRELRKLRDDLAKTKAAEEAYNATSAKDRAAATKASNARMKALSGEAAALKLVLAQQTKYRDRQVSTTTAVRAATTAIQRQNTALTKNIALLAGAAEAARSYGTEQKKISSVGGATKSSVDALAKQVAELRQASDAHKLNADSIDKETTAFEKGRKAQVEFVDGVGEVNKATGEVTKEIDNNNRSTSLWSKVLQASLNRVKKAWDDAGGNIAAHEQLIATARLRVQDVTTKIRAAEVALSNARKKFASDSVQVENAENRLLQLHNRLRLATYNLEKEFSNAGKAADGLWAKIKKIVTARDSHGGIQGPWILLIPLFAAVAAAINPLIALLGSLGAAALGLAGNIGSLSGVFLALPGILSAVAAGIGSVILSVGGISNVFKAYNAAKQAQSSGGTTSQAQDPVVRAHDLALAEWNLGQAQKGVKKAQDELNKAREQALKDLIALRTEVSRASLYEGKAVADLQKAREEYNNVLADPGSTKGDKLEAAAAVKQAEADLADVRKQNVQNQKDLVDAEKKGIEGSDKVVAAKDSLATATHSASEAQYQLNQQQKKGTDQAASVVKANNDYQDALNKLSPSAQRFVKGLIAMQGQWTAFRKNIQEAFFSKFVGDLGKLPGILQLLTSFLKPAASAMGEFTHNLIVLLSSKEWKDDFATIGGQNATVLKNLGDGALELLGALKDITVAAGPFTNWLTGRFKEGAKNFHNFVSDARDSGSLASWLEKVEGRLSKWWAIIKNIGATLFNYSAAASGFGDWLSDGFLKMTQNWKKASEEARKDGSPFQKYLEDIKPVLSSVKDLLGSFFGWFKKVSTDPETIKGAKDLVDAFTTKLGPALSNFFSTLGKTHLDQKLVDGFSSIVNGLTGIAKAGGDKVFIAFFDTVDYFLKLIASIPTPVLSLLLQVIGVIAAVKFLGGITGILGLTRGLIGLAGKAGAINGVVRNLSLLSALKFGGLITAISMLLDPNLVSGVQNLVAGLSGFDTSNVSGLAKEWDASASQKDMFGYSVKQAFMDNPSIEQSRNPVFDLGRSYTSDNAWQQIDDILRQSLKDDDRATFVNAWADLQHQFGSDAQKLWVYAFKQGKAKKWITGLLPDLKNVKNNVTPKGFNFFGTGPKATTGDHAGAGNVSGGGGMSVGLAKGFNPGVADGVKKDTDKAQTFWDTFWKKFNLPTTGPLGTLKSNLNTTFSWIKTNIWDKFKLTTDGTFNWIKTNVWDPFKKNTDNTFKWIDAHVFQPFRDAGNRLQGWAATIVAGIGKEWDKISAKFSGPINWVITNVWNNGIVSFWNTLAGKLGLPKLSKAGLIAAQKQKSSAGSASSAVKNTGGGSRPNIALATGGVLPGYTPGRDVHEFYSTTGGRLSLSGGEAIMRPEWTRAQGGPKAIAKMNNDARHGKFASGGVIGDIESAIGGVAKETKLVLSNLFADPVGAMGKGLKSVLNLMTSGMSSSGWSGMAKKLPAKMVDGLVNFVKKNVFGGGAVQGGNSTNGIDMGWQRQWEIIKNAFPGATLYSAYRNPATNAAVGGVSGSYHTLGRAIDVTPSSSIFDWIKKHYPNSRELIYSPENGNQVRNGQNYFWPEPIRGEHWNHVHWAMRNGGIYPGVYDNGGWLPTGGLAVNASGKPEAVLDPQESKALKSLLAGAGLKTGIPALGVTPANAAFKGVSRIVDNSINIEKVEVNNPVPEKMSQSLPKSIRRIGYMNQARTSDE